MGSVKLSSGCCKRFDETNMHIYKSPSMTRMKIIKGKQNENTRQIRIAHARFEFTHTGR